MALIDMYQITHKATNVSQNLLNVYHVERSAGTVTASDIAQAFQDSIMASLIALQNTVTLYDSVFVENLDDPTDFDTLIQTGQAGGRLGANAPTGLAFEIRFPRERRDMHDGFKRWGGLSEETFSSQDLAAAFIADMGLLGDNLVLTWEQASAPGVAVCDYVIIKRICTVQPPPTPCPSYRLPETTAELVFYKPLKHQEKTTVRTQVSRRVPAT